MNEMTKNQKGSETLWRLLTVLFDPDALIREVAPGEYEIALKARASQSTPERKQSIGNQRSHADETAIAG